MKFGEKLKELRTQKGWSQLELASKLKVTTRTIAAYESCSSYPRRHDFYDKLAALFEVDVNYLRTENEDFMAEVGTEFGSRGQRQYERAITEVRKLFAGGELPDEDQIAFIAEVQQLFLDSKKRSKKFAPKKRGDSEQDALQ